jgi:hypothetical protein
MISTRNTMHNPNLIEFRAENGHPMLSLRETSFRAKSRS